MGAAGRSNILRDRESSIAHELNMNRLRLFFSVFLPLHLISSHLARVQRKTKTLVCNKLKARHTEKKKEEMTTERPKHSPKEESEIPFLFIWLRSSSWGEKNSAESRSRSARRGHCCWSGRFLPRREEIRAARKRNIQHTHAK